MSKPESIIPIPSFNMLKPIEDEQQQLPLTVNTECKNRDSSVNVLDFKRRISDLLAENQKLLSGLKILPPDADLDSSFCTTPHMDYSNSYKKRRLSNSYQTSAELATAYEGLFSDLDDDSPRRVSHSSEENDDESISVVSLPISTSCASLPSIGHMKTTQSFSSLDLDLKDLSHVLNTDNDDFSLDFTKERRYSFLDISCVPPTSVSPPIPEKNAYSIMGNNPCTRQKMCSGKRISKYRFMSINDYDFSKSKNPTPSYYTYPDDLPKDLIFQHSGQTKEDASVLNNTLICYNPDY